MNHRKDIDGLRAIAVVPVVLFHSGFDILPGGFSGVDVFFVISGFLITKLLLREFEAGAFSLLRFYERRARRILPALFVVISACFVLGLQVMLADQYKEMANSAISSIFFSSNFYFWSMSGYFAPVSELMPLLHTWSLSVEEQFYIFFPLILMLLSYLRWNIRIFLPALGGVLFFLGLYLSYTKPSAAFYLLPARSWELLLGASLAAGAIPDAQSSALRNFLSIAGLLLILSGFLFIESNSVFPGALALAPCGGAALLIYSGTHKTIACRLLQLRPLVFIGLISYSLYLWHWPVLVFMRIISASEKLTTILSILAIIVSLVLATLSWRFVERPFRDTLVVSRATLTVSALATVCVIFASAAAVITAAGFPQRHDVRTTLALKGASDVDPLRIACRNPFFGKGGRKDECRFGASDQQPSYVIFGDSHAAALRPAIDQVFSSTGRTGTMWWSTRCTPMLGNSHSAKPQQYDACEALLDGALKALAESPELEIVLLSARWQVPSTGSLPEVRGALVNYITDDQSKEKSRRENLRAVGRGIHRMVHRLQSMGKKVILIGGVPEAGFDVPVAIALARFNGANMPPTIELDEFRSRFGGIDAALRGISQESSARYISLGSAFCTDVCAIEMDGIPLYVDDDHISVTAARNLVAPILAREIGDDIFNAGSKSFDARGQNQQIE